VTTTPAASPADERGAESGGNRPLRSLHARITLWYGGLLALCLLAYSAAVVVFFTQHIEAEMDRRVHEDVELAARAIVVSASGRPHWRGGRPPWSRVQEEPGGGHWLEVWSLTGERLLADGTQDPIDLGRAPGIGGGHAARTLALPTGPVRVLTERILLDGQPFLLRVAVSEGSARQFVRTMWAEVLGLCLGVLTVGGLGGYVLARRALGPLERIAERARRITAEELHERLPPETSSVELEQLTTAFNDTLARLEGSFDQLRRFTADASHELRTPLTALRSVGEVGLRSGGDADGYREVIGSMLEEVDRLTRLLDELLTLARADAGEARLKPETLDLADLALEVAGHLSVLAEERGQALEVVAPEPVRVRGDRFVLRQALVNLVDNAIKYAPERTRVRIAAGWRDGSAVLEVSDQGPGIPDEHRDRVFDRFYRVERSRSREMGGAGLGLSLVRWAAEAHRGRVELDSEEGRGSTFRIVFPAAVLAAD